MNAIVLSIVVVGLLTYLAVGLLVSWNRQIIAEDYFLAGHRLPWYAVALGIVGAGFGLESLLSVMGVACTLGLAAAGFAWNHVIAYTLLLAVFLPYFHRKRLYSAGEFVERRYNRSTRVVFAALTLGALLGMLVPVLYSAGWLLCQAGFGWEVQGLDWRLAACVVVVALATAVYSVYGGLGASVWAGVAQMLVFFAGAALLAGAAAQNAGGLSAVIQANAPPRMDLLPPLNSPLAPWTGMAAFGLLLAVWHAGANPATVQRCLGARSEWDSRMGVAAAGLLRLLVPALIVLPGLAVFTRIGMQNLTADTAFLTLLNAVLVGDSLPGAFARGLVIAGLLGALMSTISAVLHGMAAIWTIDVCQDLLQKRVSEADLVRLGRRSSAAAIVLGTILAPFLFFWEKGGFDFMLEVAAIIAPPIAVIFSVAFFWPRAHGRAATTTLLLGAAAGVLLLGVAEFGLLVPDWLKPALNRAGMNGLFSLIVLGLATLILPQNARELDDPDTSWSLAAARLPPREQDLGGGPRSLLFWWAVMCVATVALWVVFR